MIIETDSCVVGQFIAIERCRSYGRVNRAFEVGVSDWDGPEDAVTWEFEELTMCDRVLDSERVIGESDRELL